MMQGKRGLSLELHFLTVPIFQAISPVHSWPRIAKWCHIEAWHWCLLGFSNLAVENWVTNYFSLNWGVEIPVCGCAVTAGFLVLWHWADKPANLATFALLWKFSSSPFLVVFNLQRRIQASRCSGKRRPTEVAFHAVKQEWVCMQVCECVHVGGRRVNSVVNLNSSPRTRNWQPNVHLRWRIV